MGEAPLESILELGDAGAFDENGLGEPAVWGSHGFFWMLTPGATRWRIGASALSDDLTESVKSDRQQPTAPDSPSRRARCRASRRSRESPHGGFASPFHRRAPASPNSRMDSSGASPIGCHLANAPLPAADDVRGPALDSKDRNKRRLESRKDPHPLLIPTHVRPGLENRRSLLAPVSRETRFADALWPGDRTNSRDDAETPMRCHWPRYTILPRLRIGREDYRHLGPVIAVIGMCLRGPPRVSIHSE